MHAKLRANLDTYAVEVLGLLGLLGTPKTVGIKLFLDQETVRDLTLAVRLGRARC